MALEYGFVGLACTLFSKMAEISISNHKHLQHVPDHNINSKSDTSVDTPDLADIAMNSEQVLNSSACTLIWVVNFF